MAAKRNKFHLSAVRAAIHGSTEGWIATIDHLVHVFDYGSTWMEDINHFFVMVCKDFLKDIHMNIIEEMDGKKKPHPSRLRGRGVEVSKTLCSHGPCNVYFRIAAYMGRSGAEVAYELHSSSYCRLYPVSSSRQAMTSIMEYARKKGNFASSRRQSCDEE